MNTRPALVRSIPFWGLVVASLASLAYGVSLLTDKLAVMTTTLTDGTATGIEVYVGQSVALLGAVLIGVGVLGVLLALAVAAASTLRARPAAEVVEPIDWTDEDEVGIEADDAATAVDAPKTTDVDAPESEKVAADAR
jgi:hypothetical protein